MNTFGGDLRTRFHGNSDENYQSERHNLIMSSKMYVGNIPFSATEADLRSLFSEFGQPTEVILMTDRETGRPRGFGFVSMDSREAMERSIQGTDGRDFQGRQLHVNEAKEREERPHVNTRGGGPRHSAKRDTRRW